MVTPSFNQGRFLGHAIASVLAQEYPNLEYIVIDGGSTDCSRDVIRGHSDSLAYWCSEPDGGQADALRKGFRRASGDILCWLNSDDLFLPGALWAVGEYFAAHPEAEVLNGGAFVIDEHGGPLLNGFWSYSEGVAATYHRLKWYGQDGVFQQSTFWRRTAYEAVGGVNPDLFFIMDKELFVRLAKRRPFDRIPRLLSCFRIHEHCKSHLYEGRRREEERRFGSQYRSQPFSALIHPLLYSWYRLESVLRKARTAGALKCGVKRLCVPAARHVCEISTNAQ